MHLKVPKILKIRLEFVNFDPVELNLRIINFYKKCETAIGAFHMKFGRLIKSV
jgi:hypothetical protein